jgi:hypothetical protein
LDDKVIVPLGIALIVLVVLILYRKQLKTFVFEANRKGIKTTLQTNTSTSDHRGSVIISENLQTGKGNKIDVGRDKTEVTKNIQSGDRQEIIARPDPRPRSKR